MSRRIPAHVLRLLHAGDAVPGESPAENLMNAVQSLILAEERAARLTIPPDAALLDLIRGAEARCFRALYAIQKEDR